MKTANEIILRVQKKLEEEKKMELAAELQYFEDLIETMYQNSLLFIEIRDRKYKVVYDETQKVLMDHGFIIVEEEGKVYLKVK